MKSRRPGFLAFSAFLALASFCSEVSAADKPSPIPKEPKTFKVKGDVKNGEKLFKTNCALCHGVKGNGKGMAGAGLKSSPTDFTNKAEMTKRTDWVLFIAVRDGGQKVGVSSDMPSYKSILTDQQIKDLLLFIRTFSSDSRPPK